jgi:hypothetical protein
MIDLLFHGFEWYRRWRGGSWYLVQKNYSDSEPEWRMEKPSWHDLNSGTVTILSVEEYPE